MQRFLMSALLNVSQTVLPALCKWLQIFIVYGSHKHSPAQGIHEHKTVIARLRREENKNVTALSKTDK